MTILSDVPGKFVGGIPGKMLRISMEKRKSVGYLKKKKPLPYTITYVY